MSCSLYRYSKKCDGRPCAGDCDFCDYFPDEEENDIKEVADELFGKIMSGDFVGHCLAPRKGTKYEIHGREQKSNTE